LLFYVQQTVIMKMEKYLKNNGFSLAAAAEDLEVTRQAVSLWEKGQRIPKKPQMQKIFDWSNGQVTAMDFYE